MSANSDFRKFSKLHGPMHALWAFTGRTCRRRVPNSCHSVRPSLALSRQSSTLSSTFDIAFPASTQLAPADPRSLASRRIWEELMDSLTRERANPSRVWNTYLELGSVMGFDDVPFEVQQRVLRKCVPQTDLLRVAAARRMQANNVPQSPHIYESRLQTLILHMRSSGRKPTLADYNFVLEQFAAVGHQTGSRHVFRELTHLGLEPTYRTYGLCLQAVAHRLTLPCPYRLRPLMYEHANSMCIELLDDMWTRHIPMTSVNFDLTLRIFKETDSHVTFERMILVGYGIDLNNPDRPPLDITKPEFFSGNAYDPIPKTLPFSTAALNTLVDMLGRKKQVSKMVAAFEVLTTPLPPPPSTNSFVEDDEYDEPAFYQFASPADEAPYKPPVAVPNTTTFNLLIRYAAKANHAVFARHYLVQAMQLEAEKDSQLRADLASRPLNKIPSPNFSVNRGTFLPPFGLSNRTRHFAFLRWTFVQASLAWKRKRGCLTFYRKWRQTHPGLESRALEIVQGEQSLPPDPPLENISDISTTSSHSAETDLGYRPVTPELSEALRVDLDAPPPPPPGFKPLDINLHISILERDVEELGDLLLRMRATVHRLSQRFKEKLGRRIWRGKDIFLMSENARVHVGRQEWMRIVKFQTSKRNPVQGEASAPDWSGREDLPHLTLKKR